MTLTEEMVADTQPFDELFFESEWRKCWPEWDEMDSEAMLDAFSYFCRTYWHVSRPPTGRQLFNMYDAQVQTARLWLEERNTLALKARQIGFSTLSGAFSFWLTFGWKDRPIVMLSRTERDAAKLLKKSKYGYRFLPDWMKLHPRAPMVESNNLVMRMTNESYIESLPSANDPARGETVFLVIVDEIGFLPNSDEAWASIEPIADVGGRVIMLGTANGEGNLLHREWMRSDGEWTDRDGTIHQIGTQDGVFASIFHGWWANGRDDAWYEGQKARLPGWQLAQEYPSNPEEAFLKSGRPVFDLEMLAEQAVREGTVEGFVTTWVEPVDKTETEKPHRYAIGADVAEGLAHGDYSSAHVLDVTTGEVVAAWHGHLAPHLFAQELAALGEKYLNALMIVEANNHGLATVTELQRLKYGPIWRRRQQGQRKPQVTERLGWMTTAQSKPFMIDELNKALLTGAMTVYSQPTVAELKVFVRDTRGKMAAVPPNHDDRVMSLALACQGFTYAHKKEYTKKPLPGHGTLGWWLARDDLWEKDSVGVEPLIGSTGMTSSNKGTNLLYR